MATESEFMKWNPDYSVNNKIIDDQHKNLIKILNKLYQGFMEKKHLDILIDVVNELEDYTKCHFKTEEDLFVKNNYIGAIEHKKEHDDFVNQVKDFKAEYMRNPGCLTYKLMTFLKNWIVNHINQTDKKYMVMFK